MTTITLPDLHPAQLRIAKHPARFKVVCCGRRFGKTLLGSTVGLKDGIKGKRIGWIAPTVKQANEGWAYLTKLAPQVPGTQIKLAEQKVIFRGGGSVEMRTEGGDPDNLRGFGLDGAILDEAALLQERSWTQVIRPALADKQGWALFISTPQHFNWFYDLFERGQDASQEDWMSWQHPTWDNPFIPQEEIDAAQRDMLPEDFDQEFGASFTAVGGAVFRLLSANVATYLRPMPAGLDFKRTGVGMDWGTTVGHNASVVCASRLSSGGVWFRSSWLDHSGSSNAWRGEANRCRRDYGATFARVDRSQSSELDRLKASPEHEGAGIFDVDTGNPNVEVRIGELQSLIISKNVFFDIDGPGVRRLFSHLCTYHRYPDSHLKAGKIVEEEDDDVDGACYVNSELVKGVMYEDPRSGNWYTPKNPSARTPQRPVGAVFGGARRG